MKETVSSPENNRPVPPSAVRMAPSVSLLVLETDPDLRRAITVSLAQEGGWRVLPAESAEAAEYLLQRETPEVIVLGLDHPHETAGKIMDLFRARAGKTRRGIALVITTDRPSDEWRRTYQPDAVIYKPFDVRYLGRRIKNLVNTVEGGATQTQAAPDPQAS